MTRPAGPQMWAPESEAADRSRLRAIQEERLSLAFDYLFECSPYYRTRFEEAGLGAGSIRTLEDLRRVPVTRKADWIPDIERNAPWGTFSPLSDQRWREAPWMLFSTSGTTRTPRLFRHTTHDRDAWGLLSARALWSYGIRSGQTALNCFYHGSVAAWGLHEGLVRLGCAVVPAGAMPSERRIFFLENVRPHVVLGTPSGLLSLARRMKELGTDPASLSVETLVCAGEPGAAVGSTKRRLERAWGAVVHDDFGCTEVAMAPLGYTCEAEATKKDGTVGVHLMEDVVIVEVLHPETLEPVGPGERGTLVVSNLYSESAPILRFDMGDWVCLDESPCACGRTHARAVGGLLGRNDHSVTVKGLQFFPSTFEDALRSIDGIGNEYRIEVFPRLVTAGAEAGGAETLPEGDEVRVVAERTEGSSLTVDEVAKRLRGVLGISVALELVEPGVLPPTEGKGLRFVDKRGDA